MYDNFSKTRREKRASRCRISKSIPQRRILTAFAILFCCTTQVSAFRVWHVNRTIDGVQYGNGIIRWNAEPHYVDGVERSLDGGLRYSIEGGSYEAFLERFEWQDPAPTVAEFQSAVEASFSAWEVMDPESGLGTDLYFVPDFDTPIVIEDRPNSLPGRFKLNRGAEIDITSWSGVNWITNVSIFGDPDSDSVTLTSGVANYDATVNSGIDIRFNSRNTFDDVPWTLHDFQSALTPAIGDALNVMVVNLPANSVLSEYYDDNFDGSTHATALETLTNSFAHLIDPLDPDNSPALSQFELCQDADCTSSPGLDSPGVVLLAEDDEIRVTELDNDAFAARQFLYPFVRVPGDFNADKVLTVEDIDLLSLEMGKVEPRHWFDLTGDEIVDQADRTFWVHDLRRTWFGDSNLDGEFNSTDFVEVFQEGQYEDQVEGNSTWATGDWNGDGDFSSTDFVLAFQDGGYEIGPLAATNAVPEPTSFVPLLLSVMAFVTQRRTRTFIIH